MSATTVEQKPRSDLRIRVLTAIVAVPLGILAVYLGGWIFALIVVLVALVAQRELYVLAEKAGLQPTIGLGLAIGAVAVLHTRLPFVEVALVLGVLAILTVELWRKQSNPVGNIGVSVLGIIYPAMLFGYVVALRDIQFGEGVTAFWLTLMLLVSVWMCDTAAYAAGRTLGRHPFFPRISPKKTWEGFAGGVVGALATTLIFALTVLPVLSILDAVLLGLIVCTVGPIGDLVASMFKRAVSAKDTGALLPGHGGALDRFDALIFAAPLVLLYIRHVVGIA